MRLYPKVVLSVCLVLLLSGSGPVWCAVPFHDDIGACLSQPDGSRVTLPCEQIVSRGRSGKSFAVKEWTEKKPGLEHPRLVVVSPKPLPVSKDWSCDLSGVLSTVPSVSRDGSTTRQRVLIVAPENVVVYCSPKGRPFLYPPLKGTGIGWPHKRMLADLAGEGTRTTTSVSIMDAGALPAMPDSADSEPVLPPPGSRDSLKWLPDGATVSVNGSIVTASFSDYGFFYVEKSDRSFGIWINAPDYVMPSG